VRWSWPLPRQSPSFWNILYRPQVKKWPFVGRQMKHHWYAVIFRCWGFWSALRLKTEADSSSRGQKDFICREEKRKATWGYLGGPGNRWSHGSGWKLIL
jgi:hypothetical protein